MSRSRTLALARFAFAVLTIVAIVAQYLHRAHPSGFYTVNFLSFFTNESNLLAAGVLSYGAARGFARSRTGPASSVPASSTADPRAISSAIPASPGYDLWRGAAVLYMTITGVVFALLLSRSDQAIPWANTVVHQLMPIVIVLDWLLVAPSGRLTPARACRWLVFPLVFFGYTLIRGASEHWYPYPFLNVDTHGYWRVIANGVGIAIAMIFVGALILFVGNRLRARGGPSPGL